MGRGSLRVAQNSLDVTCKFSVCLKHLYKHPVFLFLKYGQQFSNKEWEDLNYHETNNLKEEIK